MLRNGALFVGALLGLQRRRAAADHGGACGDAGLVHPSDDRAWVKDQARNLIEGVGGWPAGADRGNPSGSRGTLQVQVMEGTPMVDMKVALQKH